MTKLPLQAKHPKSHSTRKSRFHPSWKKLFSAPAGLVAIAVVAAGLLIGQVRGAGSASLTLSPASGSVLNGNNITLSVYENSGGEAVNAVQANLTYDPAKLQYVSANVSSSPFNVGVGVTGGGGSVSFARGVIGSLTGQQLVGTVTFKALTGSGSASVSFASNSAIVRVSDSQNIWNGNTSGGSYSLTSPASPPPAPSPSPTPAPSPSPSPSPSPTPAPSPSPSPTPTPSPTPGTTPTPTPAPAAFTLKTTALRVGFTQARVVVIASVPVKAQVLYGLHGKSLSFTTPAIDINGAASVALDSKLLGPGLKYDYQVKATDAAGQEVTTELKSFTTRGFRLRLWLKDRDGKPFRRHKVTLHSEPQEGQTDDEGYVTFEDVSPGQHEVLVAQGDKTYTQSVIVEDNRTESDIQLDAAVAADSTTTEDLPAAIAAATSAPQQEFALAVPTTVDAAATSGRTLAAAITVALAAVLGVATWFFIQRRGQRPNISGFGGNGSDSGGINAGPMGPPADSSSPITATPPDNGYDLNSFHSKVPTPSSVIHPEEPRND